MKRLIDSIDRIRGRLSPKSAAMPRFPVQGEKVLVCYLFSGLGDAALLAPALKALLDAGAEPPLGLLAPKAGARLFASIDLAVKPIFFEEGDEAAEKIEKKIRARKFGVAIDLSLREHLDARRFLAASNAKVRLGWMRAGETPESAGLDFGVVDERHQAAKHWSRYQVMPLAPLGIERPSFDVPYARSKEAAKKAQKLWGKPPRLLLVPGSRSEEKRWDEERFVALGRYAREARGASIVVLGAPSEAKIARRIARETGGSAFTGKDLAVMIELIRGSDLVITNDTGPMHLAFALERPTIAIFTYMTPLVWGPPRNDPRFVVLNARGAAPGTGGDDAWTRLARHHLERFLDLAGR